MWHLVWLACCESEKRWVGGEIHQLAGPDHARPGDHGDSVILFSVP